eukprot:3859347-Pleurochrysis_carterae.AAC.1
MAAHVARRDSVNGRMTPSLNECTFDVMRAPVPADSCVCKPAATVFAWFTTAAHVGKLTVEGVAPIVETRKAGPLCPAVTRASEGSMFTSHQSLIALALTRLCSHPT